MTIKKLSNTFGKLSFLVIGFIVGLVVMYLYLQPNITFFKTAYNTQENAYNKVTNYTCTQKDVDAFLKEFNTKNSPYHWYLTGTASLACRNGFKAFYTHDESIPTPTPIVEYKTQTQYVQEPAQDTGSTSLRCYSDLLGGQYCNSADGTRTHCTPNGIGGMNCR